MIHPEVIALIDTYTRGVKKARREYRDRPSVFTERQPPGETAIIRAWAQRNGHDVKAVGKLPHAVIAAYAVRHEATDAR